MCDELVTWQSSDTRDQSTLVEVVIFHDEPCYSNYEIFNEPSLAQGYRGAFEVLRKFLRKFL